MYTFKGLNFTKEKQLEVLRDLIAAVEDDKAELTGTLLCDGKITVWGEVIKR